MAKRRPAKPSMRVKDGRQQPFTWFPNELLREHGAAIGPYAGWVYMALLTHANKEASCWPAHETLATMTGMSTRHVKRSLKRLESLGLISITMRRPKTSVYTILEGPEAPVNRPREPITNEAPNGSASPINGTTSPINGSASPIEQDPQSHEVDVVEVDPPNQIHRTTSSPTPPFGSTVTPAEEEEAAAAMDCQETERQGASPVVTFGAFWQAYPWHQQIERAREAWVTLAPDATLVATILAALEVQTADNHGRYLPRQAAKYLTDQRWLDAKPQAAKEPPAWPEEDEPAEIPTCDVRNCHHLAGRYSSKRCDQHVEEDLRAEAGQLLEILRGVVPTAYDTDYAAATALEEQLGRRAKQYHTPETAWDIAWQVSAHYSPEKLPTYEDILATICRIQEAAEAGRRARAAQPKRKLELQL